jgi:hypothetical protein
MAKFYEKKISSYIRQALLKYGINVTRAVSDEKLSHFFNLINPIISDKKLVRVGDEEDGGYLVPFDLNGIEACFSPGVSLEASFELNLAKFGVKSYMADYSVNASPIENNLFDFEKKYLGAQNDEIFMTLQSWVDKKEPNGSDFILQMDIEGAEYEVIYQSPVELLKKFRIIIIEFHSLGILFSPGGYEIIRLAFKKLLEHFEIVHIHPNNCVEPISNGRFEVPPVMEFTFLRKDRVLSQEPAKDFPHILDVKNFPDRPDVVLPDCWRGMSSIV